MGAFVLGYHGCDRDFGEALLAGKKSLIPSRNDHDWLGHGVYFWENNPKRALAWARFMAKHPKFKDRVKSPFAVGAVIDLGNCLDLTESESLGIVRASYEELAILHQVIDLPLPENRSGHEGDSDLVQRFLDCAVLNNVHALREEENLENFSTVRAPFSEGGELYPGAKIQSKTHIQICVREAKRIRGVFRLKE